MFFCFFVLRVFCFSLENDATHAKHAQACFFFLHSLWEFLRKTETFLNSVNICRFCTGKRKVFCKKHYNLCFFQENLCLSQESYTAHAEQKKKKPWCAFFFALRALPAPSLTHSLAYPWLLGGNSNLKQNLSFIKAL